jgi:hypothetical protein
MRVIIWRRAAYLELHISSELASEFLNCFSPTL